MRQGLPIPANVQHERHKMCVHSSLAATQEMPASTIYPVRRPLALLASASSTSHRPRPSCCEGRAAARQLTEVDSDLGPPTGQEEKEEAFN